MGASMPWFDFDLAALLQPAALTAGASALFALASVAVNVVLLRRQNRVQLEALRIQSDSDVIAWGRDAIDALADAQRLIAVKPHITETAFEQDRHTAMQRLSSLADQGRLFFPNATPDRHGQDKEHAFKGFRQPIIDSLVFAFSALEHWPDVGRHPAKAIAFLWSCRRVVVSEIQASVDPRRRHSAISSLAKRRRGRRNSQATPSGTALGDALKALSPKAYENVTE